MSTEKPQAPAGDPAVLYGTPEAVLDDGNLTAAQKIEILRRWQYDVAEEAVAVEEGMPGDEPSLMRRIVLALETLAGPLDLERTGTAKQHGFAHDVTDKSK